MYKLSEKEIRMVSGGCASSDDPNVQAGMDIGCAIGRAVGSTFRNFGDIMKALNPFK